MPPTLPLKSAILVVLLLTLPGGAALAQIAQTDLLVRLDGFPDTVEAGGNFSYTVEVFNAGPIPSGNPTRMVLTLSPDLTFRSVSAALWVCSHDSGVVTCISPGLAPIETSVISVQVTAPPFAGSVSSLAEVSGGPFDPVPSNNLSVEETFILPASANLSITGQASPHTVNAGGLVTFELRMNNAGPQTAVNAVATTLLPAGSVFRQASSPFWNCQVDQLLVTCLRRIDWSVGQDQGIRIEASAPTTAGVHPVRFDLVSTTPDPQPSNNSFTLMLTVTEAIADLSITMADSPDPVNATGLITYTLQARNLGPGTAFGVQVVDTLPAGVTFVGTQATSWACSFTGTEVRCFLMSLVIGAPAPIRIQVTAPPFATELTNTATVRSVGSFNSAPVPDSNPLNDTATQITTVQVQAVEADLLVRQSDSPDPVVQGTPLAYTLTVTNSGPTPSDLVTVTDTLPAGAFFLSAAGNGWSCGHSAGIVTCSRLNLAVVDSPPITISLLAPTPLGSVTNEATVSAITPDPVPANNHSSEQTTVAPPPASSDLFLVKLDDRDPVLGGETITYTLTAGNLGPQTAGGIVVVDTLPITTEFVGAAGPGWSCQHQSGIVTCLLAELPPGEAPALQIEVLTPAQGGLFTNTARISADGVDPVPDNNLALQQTLALVPSQTADLSLSLSDTKDPVEAAAPITYLLVTTNHGPLDALDVLVTDTLPAGVTLVSAAGPGWSCAESAGVLSCGRAVLPVGPGGTIQVSVTAPGAGAVLLNQARISSSTADPNPANNAASETTRVNNPLAPVDLSLVMTDSPDPVAATTLLSYVLEVTNAGPETAFGISLEDPLPAGVTFVQAAGLGWSCFPNQNVVGCFRDSLPGGGSAPVTLTVTAPDQPAVIQNSATVSSVSPELDPDDNVATQTTTIGPPPVRADLALHMLDAPDPVEAGQPHSYLLTVSNAGPGEADSLVVSDPLPSGEFFLSASGTGWSCSESERIVTCTLASLPVGPAPALTLRTSAAGRLGFRTNVASVTSATPDPDLSNNSAAARGTINAPRQSASLALTIDDAQDPVPASGIIDYLLTASNLGPDTAPGLRLEMTLPGSAAFEASEGAGWTCAEAPGRLVCDRPSLGPGQSAPLVISARAPSSGGEAVARALVRSRVADPVIDDNFAGETTVVGPPLAADLSLAGRVEPDPALAGSVLTYHLDAANQGPWPGEPPRVRFTPPAGSLVKRAFGAGWSCAPEAADVLCVRAGLGVGEAAPLTILVEAPATAGEAVAQARIDSATADPSGADNVLAVESTIVPAGDLASLSLAASPGALLGPIGSEITYSIGLLNQGPLDAAGVLVRHALPAGLDFVSAEPAADGGGPDPAGELRFSLGAPLPAGETLTIRITARCAAPFTPVPAASTVESATAQLDLSDDAADTWLACVQDRGLAQFEPADVGARSFGRQIGLRIVTPAASPPVSLRLARVDDRAAPPLEAIPDPAAGGRFLFDAEALFRALHLSLGACTEATGRRAGIEMIGERASAELFSVEAEILFVNPDTCDGAGQCLSLLARRLSIPAPASGRIGIVARTCEAPLSPGTLRLSRIDGHPVVPVPIQPAPRPGRAATLGAADAAAVLLEALGGCLQGWRGEVLLTMEADLESGQPFEAFTTISVQCARSRLK